MHSQTFRQLGLTLLVTLACTGAAFAQPFPQTEAPPGGHTSPPGPVRSNTPVQPHGGASGGSEPLPAAPPASTTGASQPPLRGWVELHAHLMSNLAFAGKLFHGGVDVGSLLPAVQMPT